MGREKNWARAKGGKVEKTKKKKTYMYRAFKVASALIV